MSYTPIRSRRSTTTPPRSQDTSVDFGAFDDPDSESEDIPSSPTLSRRSTATNPGSFRSSTNGRTGGISLGDSFSDPLTAGESSPNPNHHTITSIPGGYDFEPQGNEGRPPAIQHRTRPLAVGGGAGVAAGDTQPRSWHRRPLSLTERFLPAAIYSRFTNAQSANHSEDSGLLFSHDGQDSSELETDAEGETGHNSGGAATYPPRGTPSHVPLPARPPSFAPPPSNPTAGGRIMGGGQGNDGVFANLSAKPEGVRSGHGADYVGGDEFGGDKDEVPPAYEVAAQDTTPPYWETTVITPQGLLGPDDICVDGMPVGNLFGFAWNLLVSMSFQFVGFLLTYLLHTTHAAKNGSRAGLGITLIQLGFYLKERIDHPELMDGVAGDVTLDASMGANGNQEIAGWTWWGGAIIESSAAAATATASATASALGSLPTQVHGALSSALDASDPAVSALRNATRLGQPSLGELNGAEMVKMSQTANEWLAFLLVTVGSFLLIGGCLSYWRAVRWASAVRQGMGPNNDAEATFVVA